MYTLAPDEKATTVMVYSPNKLIHGDLVTKQNARVSLLPRMGMPGYVHFVKTEVLFFGGEPPKSEPFDYDPDEENRIMLDVDMILGAFMLKGKIRTSTHADFVTNLEAAHTTWLSVYF